VFTRNRQKLESYALPLQEMPGSDYLGDLSEHFFQVQEGSGYPSEEQDAWLVEVSAST
jgi:hypothetical protein